jgi:hypothetical protein
MAEIIVLVRSCEYNHYNAKNLNIFEELINFNQALLSAPCSSLLHVSST